MVLKQRRWEVSEGGREPSWPCGSFRKVPRTRNQEGRDEAASSLPKSGTKGIPVIDSTHKYYKEN